MILRQLLLASVLLLPLAAQAHYPVMDCSRMGDEIACRIGFSDGTLAHGSEVVMYSYGEEVIHRVRADNSSTARFPWHDGEFFIQFDAGHEDPAEFDHVEF
ncbi:hypothetical protein [Marinospirillum alkaliphilum]|uniref:Uncharacterized protein n=1 Tax=Marinospirillum alkaliphilum DSM 21637 TaxID=1122209 RepID=A0A1K1UWX7_9GAMM|nr:hypothetical protein [Marinospirillum alkaliphilum]SFX17362.1 hypothetical protein SAMN02745752_00650 [Marinospirillum alkaliphilum DSM 21637]